LRFRRLASARWDDRNIYFGRERSAQETHLWLRVGFAPIAGCAASASGFIGQRNASPAVIGSRQSAGWNPWSGRISRGSDAALDPRFVYAQVFASSHGRTRNIGFTDGHPCGPTGDSGIESEQTCSAATAGRGLLAADSRSLATGRFSTIRIFHRTRIAGCASDCLSGCVIAEISSHHGRVVTPVVARDGSSPGQVWRSAGVATCG
jgi:prepilin-type processing-associated H-X9-DG protein